MKLYFVTDIHGSDICFKKFINAAKYYGVNVLIMGGDITGKLLVPLVRKSDGGYRTHFNGQDLLISSDEEKQAFIKNIKFNGFYPLEMDDTEYQKALNDKAYKDSLFEKVMLESVLGWMSLAEERLKDTKVQVFITSGNDDLWALDKVLKESETEHVHFVEGEVASIGEGYEMISLGDANKTPWSTPREFTEEVLYQKLSSLAKRLQSPSTAIFNVHVPPIGSGLDVCAELDANLKPVVRGGEIMMKAAGSTAVKKVIEETQPLVGLHGHIHESAGIAKVGRTVCMNPGSEYSQGILKGALVTIEKGKLKQYVLTKG